MSDITKFDYEGQSISFEFSDGNKMIHANPMAEKFEKRIDNFLRLQGTKDFILLLESDPSHVRDREILRVVKGGEPELQGTWMHEKLALKFASWLSPKFELWVYDRIQELLKTGQTSLQGIHPTSFAKTLRLLAEQWEQQEQINQTVRAELDYTAEKLGELEAKITSSDENYFTIAGYCALNRIHCPLDKAKAWGKAATGASRAKGVDTGAAHDERYGKVRTYHQDILKEVIG